MLESKKYRCRGCGDFVEYEGRQYSILCPNCRKLRSNVRQQQYEKRKRKRLKKGKNEARIAAYTPQVGGASYAECARLMRMDFREVQRLERKVLLKIRSNPELKEIWGTIKELMAEGRPLSWDGLLVSAEDRINDANKLLDYQMKIAEWWQDYEIFMEAVEGTKSNRERKIMLDSVVSIVKEIESVQVKIRAALQKMSLIYVNPSHT